MKPHLSPLPPLGDRITQMQSNVSLSQGHVAKQEVIIARLVAQGHGVMADEAKALLGTMHEHLANEVEMLRVLEQQAS